MSEEQPQPEQKTDALSKTEPRLEKITNPDGQSQRLAARNRTGQFERRATILAADTAKRITKLAYTPDAEGKTVIDKVLESQLTVASKNDSAKNLGQVSQLLETIDEFSGQKMARMKAAKEPEQPFQIRTIFITMPDVPMAKEPTPSPTQPSWARQEIPVAEVTHITNNAAHKTTTPAKPIRERRVAQIPKPYNTSWRRKDDGTYL